MGSSESKREPQWFVNSRKRRSSSRYKSKREKRLQLDQYWIKSSEIRYTVDYLFSPYQCYYLATAVCCIVVALPLFPGSICQLYCGAAELVELPAFSKQLHVVSYYTIALPYNQHVILFFLLFDVFLQGG